MKINYKLIQHILFSAFLLSSYQTDAANLDVGNFEGSDKMKEAIKNWQLKNDEKIIGGKDANINQFPWQVSLSLSWIADPYYAHFCGGSIIDEEQQWVLTAAHCVDDANPIDIHVLAGAVDIDRPADKVNVNSIYIAKDYKNATDGKDIALLKLERPLKRHKYISNIVLNDDPNLIQSNSQFTISGWGATSMGGNASRILQFIDNVPIIDSATCNRTSFYSGAIKADMLCTGFIPGGKDSCQGDSGGPHILTTNDGKSIQTGIVSWGEGCALPNRPGVYTRVSVYASSVYACLTDLHSNDCSFE